MGNFKLKPVAATLLGATFVTSSVLAGAVSADAATSKVKKVATGVKVTKSGKLISKKTGKSVKGIVSYKGKVYKNGKKASGVVGGFYYKNGKKATGLSKGVYYKNGVKGTGTYKGILYSKGKKAQGLVKGIYYKAGKKATDVIKDTYYKNGKKASGLFKDVYYENGKALTDADLQKSLESVKTELTTAQTALKDAQQQQADLEAIEAKLGGTKATTSSLKKLANEDVAAFIAKYKDVVSFTDEEKAAVQAALAGHKATVDANVQAAAEKVVQAAAKVAEASTKIAQVSKDEKTVAEAQAALEEVKKAVETVKAIPGVKVDSASFDNAVKNAESAIEKSPVKPAEPTTSTEPTKPTDPTTPGTTGGTPTAPATGGNTVGGGGGSTTTPTVDVTVSDVNAIVDTDGQTVTVTANVKNSTAKTASLEFFKVTDGKVATTANYQRDADIKDGKITFSNKELAAGTYQAKITVDGKSAVADKYVTVMSDTDYAFNQAKQTYKDTVAAVTEVDYTVNSWTAYQKVVKIYDLTAEDNTVEKVEAKTTAILNAQKDLVKTPEKALADAKEAAQEKIDVGIAKVKDVTLDFGKDVTVDNVKAALPELDTSLEYTVEQAKDDSGQAIDGSYKVIVQDTAKKGEAKSATIKVTVAANQTASTFVTGVSVINTTPKVGDVISANVTMSDAQTAAARITYQWMVSANDGTTWTNALGTGNTTKDYTVDSTDQGKILKVVVIGVSPVTGTQTSIVTGTVASANGIQFGDDQYSNIRFEANTNMLKFSTKGGALTAAIDTKKFSYSPNADGTGAYTLTGSYTSMGYTFDPLKPGEYSYTDFSNGETYIELHLTDEDSAAIKALQGFGNTSKTVQADTDYLYAADGWYAGAIGGHRNITLSNSINITNNSSHKVNAVYEYIKGVNYSSGGRSISKGNSDSYVPNALTDTLVIYEGTYTPNVTPISGFMKIIKLTPEIISTGITVDDTGWVAVDDTNFGQ